ncbi:hypothetical protein BJ138DRAFT_38708 [Hygrophoropsis aurantiaca]|uniref:Uncharacterized protein n=1 Tax=Hygrophoropsis aurantiaca TaxID=72124 RepID=A0ACB8AD62_9AGAM|nr:hypothetical protein BJ138DRAFT_38708 [Hygrophoropsis aurantiaca]
MANQSPTNETDLRSLSRVNLQKLAKTHNIKANQKSEILIRILLKINEELSREHPIELSADTRATVLLTPKSQSVALARPDQPGPSRQNISPPAHELNASSGVDVGETEGKESDLSSVVSQDTQPTYATQPSCSDASTPPFSEIRELERAVKIMRNITTADKIYLNQISSLNEAAAQFRKHAAELRAVLRAEKGRRIRMEAYFTYWREIEPEWPKESIYGETAKELEVPPEFLMRNLTPVSGPPTIPLERQAPRGLGPPPIAAPVPMTPVNISNMLAGPILPSPQPSLRSPGLKRKSRG